MDFNSDKPIYLQLYERICESALSGQTPPESRIPSVREYGAEVGVNPNTVMRTYEKLTREGIIYNKRGIGYFVSPDAPKIILEHARQEFLTTELPELARRMKLLGITPEEVMQIISRN